MTRRPQPQRLEVPTDIPGDRRQATVNDFRRRPFGPTTRPGHLRSNLLGVVTCPGRSLGIDSVELWLRGLTNWVSFM